MNTYMNRQTASLGNIDMHQDRQELTLMHLQQSAAQALTGCVSSIQTLLDKRGIHTPPAIQLTMALNGYVIVEEGRVDKALLEDILNGNTVIVAGLKEVEVLHRMVHGLTASSEAMAEIFHVGVTSLGGVAFFTLAHKEKSPSA